MALSTVPPSASAHSPTQHECFVDADDAALALGLSPKTLQRWSRQGIVPAHPIGEGRRKYWRYLISELEAWLLKRTAQTARRTD